MYAGTPSVLKEHHGTLRDVPWCPSTQLSVPPVHPTFLLLTTAVSLTQVGLRLVLLAVCVFVFWKSPPFPFFLSLLTTADSSSLSSEGESGQAGQT